MAIIQEGHRPQEKVDATKRESKIKAACEKHKGKRVSEMTTLEQGELLEAIATKLGLADENGEII